MRDGVVLGLLAAWQVLIGEEVLLLTAVGLAVGGVVYLAHGRLPLRRMLPGLGAAAGGLPRDRRRAAVVAVRRAAELWRHLPPAGRQRPRPAVGAGHPQHRRRPVRLRRSVDEPHRGELVLRRPAAGRGRGRRRRAVAPRPGSGPRRGRRGLVLALARRGGHGQRQRRPASRVRGRCSSSCRCSATCCRPASPSSRCPLSGRCSRSASRRCAGSRPGMPGTPAPAWPSARLAGAAGAAAGRAHPARRRPAGADAGVLQRRHVARLGRRGRLGARGAGAVGRRHPGPGVAGARRGGASRWSRATSSAPTPRRSAAASTAPRRPR